MGATVDYAILMTTRYQKERQRGREKMEAISIAHKTSMPSIYQQWTELFRSNIRSSLLLTGRDDRFDLYPPCKGSDHQYDRSYHDPACNVYDI